VDIQLNRRDLQGKAEKTGGDCEDELFVQVGEHTQVFKYGEREDEKPRLIDEYISYFKDGDQPHKKALEIVTKPLIRGRSHSMDAFYKGTR